MYYSLCVATDFRGHKVNLQFFFDSNGPQLAQILSRATEAFNQYYKTKGVDRPFTITTAVIFNEQHETWDRLERSSQLVHNGQIYLFQPDVNDVPAEIPDPISATQFLTEYVSPQRSFVNTSTTYNSVPRSASPGAQIPSSYEPYYRRSYHDASPAYNPGYSSYGGGATTGYGSPTRNRSVVIDASPYSYNYASPSRIGGGGGGGYTGNAYPAATSSGGGYTPSRDNRSSKADLESNPDYQALMRRAASSQPRRSEYNDGPSIFAEERQHEADLSRLTLDQFRDVARNEAKEFSPSPSRERSYY